MTRRPRLLLADDHPLFLEGVRRLLESKYDVVGTVADGKALVAAAQNLRPDIIVVDISMPEMNGLAAAQIIRKTVPSAKFIVLSVHSDQAYAREAFRGGRRGYVSKRAAGAELLTAIKQVLEGRTYVTPLVSPDTPAGPTTPSGSPCGNWKSCGWWRRATRTRKSRNSSRFP